MLLRSWLERFGKKLVVGRGRRKPPLAALERLETRSLMSVNPTAVSFTATEADTFSGTVATFTSKDASPQSAGSYTATIDWGGGAKVAGTVIADGAGFDVVGTHEYMEAGTPDIKITINDAVDKSVKTLHSQASVLEQPITLTVQAIEATEGTAFSGSLGTFSDPGTSGDPDEYVAKINWGDGQTSFGTLSHTGGASFDLSGRHTYSDEGSYTATATVWESNSPATNVSAPISVTVDDGDNFAFTNMTVAPAEGRTFSGVVSVMLPVNDDANSSDFTASINWGDGQSSTAGVIHVSENGWWQISGSHTYGDEGWYKIRTTISEDGPNGASFTSKSVAIVSDSDVLDGTGLTLDATEGSAFSGAVATFANTGYPGNPATDFSATIDWGDGTIDTGTVSGSGGNYAVSGNHIYQDEGFYTPVVTLNDRAPGTASATICSSMTVADADILTGSGSTLSAIEGSSFAGPVATFTNTGYADNPATDFAATIDWGDGTIDAGTVSGGGGSFTVIGSHTYQDEGSYSATVTLSDAAKGSDSATAVSSMTVADADSLTGAGISLSAIEGSAFSGAVALFTNSYTGNSVSDFTATIDWGDGTTDTGTLSGAGGNFTVSGSHTYQDEGSYAPIVTLSDVAKGSASATATSSMIVADADVLAGNGINLTASEGAAFNDAVAIFTNSYTANSASDFTATIDWGDGTIDAGTVSGGSGSFTVSGSHTYQDEGNFLPVVTLSDMVAGSANATAVSSMTVADTDALSGTGTTLAATEGSTFSGAVATFTNGTYATNSAADFTATIDWGDGTTTAGTVSAGSGVDLTVSGSHAYADEGSFPVTVTLADDAPGAAAATLTMTAIVDEGDSGNLTPMTITPTEAQAFSGAVAGFTDPGNPLQVADDFTAAIDWGDGTATAGTITGPTGGPFTISGNHTYADDGNYTLLASFADDAPSALAATITSTASVADVDALVGTGAALSASENIPINTAIATFSDTNASADPGDFTAQIDWGDGTTGLGTVSGGGGADLTVTGNHTYAEEGAYTITTTLNDVDGTATATATSTAAVAENTFGLTAGPVLTATEGQSVTAFPVATFQDPGSPDDASSFAATIDWGDGVTDAGTITGKGGSFTVTGSHSYTEEFTGSYSVTVSEPDANFTFGPVSNSVTVSEGDSLSPVLVTTGTITENQAVGGVAAVFHDSGYATNDPADFSGTFDWGDGTTFTTTAGNVNITSDGSGSFTLSVAGHAYADEGVYTVVATLADDAPGSATDSQTGTLTVSEADSLTPSATPATLTGTEGMSVSGSVATFSNTGYASNPAADFTATVDWGDGTTTAGNVSGGSGVDLTVDGSHAYADDGSYTITTTITDDAPGTAIATTTATANIAEADLSLSPAAATLAFTEGTTYTGAVATISDPGSADLTGSFTANIDWGDGTTTTGTVTGAAGAYTVVGSHAYADERAYTIAVTAAEVGAVPVATASASLAASVADADALSGGATSVTTTEGSTFSGAVATFTSANTTSSSGDFSATIDWGDGTTTAGTVSGSAGAFTVNGSHSFADEGSFATTIEVNESAPGTQSTTLSGTASVAEGDSLSVTASPVSTTQGTPFNGQVAMFTDAGYANKAVGDLAATIDWGDGTLSAGTIASGAGGTFTVSGTHTYQTSAASQLEVTLSDASPGTATATSKAAVSLASVTALGSSPIVGSSATVNGYEFTSANNVTVATFTHTGSDPTSNFSVSINWGDGTSSTGTVALSGSVYSVTGSHGYTDEGTFAVKVSIDDVPDSVSATVNSSATMLEELLPGGVRGTADERFINEVYRDILGRPADANALAFYDAQLAASLTRVTVASEIIAAADAGELRDQLIQQAFQKLLHRSAEAGALTYFGQLLASGTSIAQVDAMIISSNEYFNVRGGGTVDGFANAVFEDLLGRSIDLTSKTNVEQFMAGGGTRFQVADLVMHSTEYENIFIENSFTTYLHRPADNNTLSFFDAQFALGASQNAIVADILGSNEYFSLVSS